MMSLFASFLGGALAGSAARAGLHARATLRAGGMSPEMRDNGNRRIGEALHGKMRGRGKSRGRPGVAWARYRTDYLYFRKFPHVTLSRNFAGTTLVFGSHGKSRRTRRGCAACR